MEEPQAARRLAAEEAPRFKIGLALILMSMPHVSDAAPMRRRECPFRHSIVQNRPVRADLTILPCVMEGIGLMAASAGVASLLLFALNSAVKKLGCYGAAPLSPDQTRTGRRLTADRATAE
jgi:hypothetical protein